MSWLYWVAGGIILLPILAMLPRVFLSGRASPEGVWVEFRGPGMGISYDSQTGRWTGRILFFSFEPRRITTKAFKAPSIRSMLSRSSASPSRSTPSTSSTPSTQTKPPAKKRTGRLDRGLILDLVKRLPGLAKKLLKCIRADRIWVDLTIGTPDAMWTGVLFGALQPLTAFSSPPKRLFQIGVDFMRETPRVDAEWIFSVRPVQWVWVGGIWLWSLPWRRIWRAFRR